MFVNVSSRDAGNSHHSSKKSDNNSVAYPSRTVVHPKLEMTEPGDADEPVGAWRSLRRWRAS